jgi:hypothetical protein
LSSEYNRAVNYGVRDVVPRCERGRYIERRLLAPNRHVRPGRRCPVSGVERKWDFEGGRSVVDPKPDMDAWALFDVRHRGFWLLECQCNTGESERHSQSLAHPKWFSEHDGGSDDADDWYRKRTNGGGRSR